MLTKPTDCWVSAEWLEEMWLGSAAVPRQTFCEQGGTLRSLLRSKERHHRQLQKQLVLLTQVGQACMPLLDSIRHACTFVCWAGK
jgi:hypothetical protein